MLTRLAHAFASNPTVYDCIQKLAGREQNYRKLAPHLAAAAGRTLLDVGAGTGECARIVPPRATYIWLDNDPDKLRGFREKFSAEWALLGAANQIGLRDKSVDIAVCVAVSHHLTDAELRKAMRELARVCRMRLIFLDAVRQETSRVSTLLWKYDRGSHPRRVEALRAAIAEWFDIGHEECYAVYHHYWLCTAAPKAAA